MQRAVSRSQQVHTGSASPGYTCTKVSVTEEMDSTGKIREHKEKVYQICSRAGSTSARLVEVNGHAPGPADVKKQSENEMSLRQLLGESKSGKAGDRDSFLTPDLVARFDFKLAGQDVVNQRPAYQIAFEPKDPEPPIHRMIDRLVNRLSGTLWIDADEFEVARAEIRLRSEVDLLGGLAGCLRTLAYSVTRMRVADGLWLNSASSGDFEGRKLLDSMRIKTKSQTTDFRPSG
jgi:hypothetical protein